MKKLLSYSLSTLLLLVVVLFGCKEDEIIPEIPLSANAGPDQTVMPLDDVTLDGSESTGPEGFTYSWKYKGTVPESDINLQGANTVSPTFSAPEAGLYEFTLMVSHNGLTDEDVVLVQATGAIRIGGTLTGNTNLINIENDPDLPDYVIESDLIVPDGITLTIESDVIIEVNQNKGIIVKGTLTNANNENYFDNIKLVGSSGWKGIHVDGGATGNALINFSGVKIENAGAAVFEGKSEAAAILFSGNLLKNMTLKGNEFVNSGSYDILAETAPPGYRSVTSNIYSYRIPVKAQIGFMDNFFSEQPDIMPANFEYIQLVPRASGTGDLLPDNRSFQFFHKSYYIDGTFIASSPVKVNGGTTIYVKENSGLNFEKETSIGATYEDAVTITGLNGASWNGILGASNIQMTLTNVVISKAGAQPLVNGKPKAAVFQMGNGTGYIDKVTIEDCAGFGVYLDMTPETLSLFGVKNSTFKNTVDAAIRTNVKSLVATIKDGNTFDLAAGVPGCLVEGDGALSSTTWPALKNSFYLIDANIVLNKTAGMTFWGGVHLKFKQGRSLNWITDGYYSPNGIFKVYGEQDNPVIFEGETDTPGSWGGLVLEGNFNINYLQVKNGGEFLLPGASNKGNVFFDFTSADNTSYYQTFSNSTISGSAGYGVVQSNASNDYDFEAPFRNNTFSGNTLGNVIKE